MGNYMFFGVLRASQLFNSFYWNYKDYYVATWTFNQLYISVFLRCFGVLLISFQRYISMCKNGRLIEQVINVSHRWVLPILHWTIPTLYSIPLLIIGTATFKTKENLELIAPKEHITMACSMACFFVSTTFIICSYCYGAMLKFLIQNRYSTSSAVKREGRLYIQMSGLFIGFMLFFVFNIVQLVFSLYTNEGVTIAVRTIFPLLSCFFSYVNAWMTLILNTDIRRKIILLISCRRLQQKVS
ncbi:hypothetical protein COOONC_22575 [Cooperia oncophora]